MGIDLVGCALGGYVIEGVVGRGGMGVVYRARDAAGGDVAIKVIAPELLTSQEARRRFSREAQYARSLEHPAILPIIGTGEADGVLFLVMPLVMGRDLKSVVLEGPVEIQRVLYVVARIAEALDAAHETGLVHRDVKPQNILLEPGTRRGEKEKVWLSDFGLVRHMSALTSSTRTGQFLGSVEYVAPEQVAGKLVDGRADVYSLACVAFECLTGFVPFPREMHAAALWAHMNDDPPRLSAFRTDLPGTVDDIFHTALAKAPEDRYLTCSELADELRRELHEHRGVVKVAAGLAAHLESEWSKVPPGPPVMRERRVAKAPPPRLGLALGAAAIALLLGIAIGTSRGRQVIGNAVAAATDVAEGVVEDITGGDAAPARGPDRLGGSEDRSPSPRRRPDAGYIRSRGPARDGGPPALVAAGPLRDAPGAPALGTFGAPTEPKIVWIVARKNWTEGTDIWMRGVSGGLPQRLTSTQQDEHWPVFSPDGAQIAFERAGDIWLMTSDGKRERRLVDCPAKPAEEPGRYHQFCGEPDWSPDGGSIAYMQGRWTIWDGWVTGDVRVVDLRSGRHHVLASGERNATWYGPHTSVTWDPLGNRLLTTCNPDDLNRAALCLLRPEGSRVREVFRSDVFFPLNAAWSPVSRGVLVVEATTGPAQVMQIWTMSLDGSRRQLDSGGRFGSYDPSWAPDGSAVAFSCWHTGLYSGDICRVSPNGEDLEVLIDSGFNDLQPDWWIPSG